MEFFQTKLKMRNLILIKSKSFLFQNIFFGFLIMNLIHFFWHWLGMPMYYIYFFFKKPYLGGYFITDQERFKLTYKMLNKSLQNLIDNFYTNSNETINILEVGVYAGGSTLQIGNFFKKNNIDNFKIYCIDHWKEFSHTQGKKWNFFEYITNKGLKSGKIFKIFNNNIKFSSFDQNVEVIVDSSKDGLNKIGNIKFDFVYIDGGHNYPTVRSDIEKSLTLLKEKSFISGDDYEITYQECDQEKIKENIEDEKLDFCLDHKSKKVYHPGVTMAVNDFFGNIPSYNGFWIQKKINKKFENIDLLNL